MGAKGVKVPSMNGNKYALGHHYGAPIKYSDTKEFKRKVNEYFIECDKGRQIEKLANTGQVITVTQRRPYTLEGLSYYLGISLETLKNYEKKGFEPDDSSERGMIYKDLFGIIKEARRRIKMDKYEGAINGEYSANFVKFDMINHHDMVDRLRNEHTGKDDEAIKVQFNPFEAEKAFDMDN